MCGQVALHYASDASRPGLVFEMQMGLVDRGAELGWISQYPHEAEVRAPFAPSPARASPPRHRFTASPPHDAFG